ncbi:TetR/AcrR family transcriptional regulator [Paucibacter aquatile]|uniref:TetR/AcrR family transcriptional regulator n=1 Tax=Kinneretia aquatilis TaxID=2070761 RepID=A0A2N8L209_9BURK|nr:TetR/AcrR family transcriptional regulator [Paucibacter aquatile]PND39744.1 TetR/AcrR family transcriptional regulator [Paucibacter aquatile]WIV97544.1 TetR/AcrR family transcriptional regulator [Paucibacter aquatile]
MKHPPSSHPAAPEAQKPEAEVSPVRERLLRAAKTCFLTEDYHQVSTRRIAELAQANVSMIRYYFGSKEGLYEEMIRATLNPLLEVLDQDLLATPEGFGAYLKLYYDTMLRAPEFPRLILRVLALRQGPGRRFVQQLLERGRQRGAQRVQGLKQQGLALADLDPDLVRMAFVSLAMTPLLLRELFEEQMERPMDASFLDALAAFNGRLLSAGLSTGRVAAATEAGP